MDPLVQCSKPNFGHNLRICRVHWGGCGGHVFEQNGMDVLKYLIVYDDDDDEEEEGDEERDDDSIND